MPRNAKVYTDIECIVTYKNKIYKAKQSNTSNDWVWFEFDQENDSIGKKAPQTVINEINSYLHNTEEEDHKSPITIPPQVKVRKKRQVLGKQANKAIENASNNYQEIQDPNKKNINYDIGYDIYETQEKKEDDENEQEDHIEKKKHKKRKLHNIFRQLKNVGHHVEAIEHHRNLDDIISYYGSLFIDISKKLIEKKNLLLNGQYSTETIKQENNQTATKEQKNTNVIDDFLSPSINNKSSEKTILYKIYQLLLEKFNQEKLEKEQLRKDNLELIREKEEVENLSAIKDEDSTPKEISATGFDTFDKIKNAYVEKNKEEKHGIMGLLAGFGGLLVIVDKVKLFFSNLIGSVSKIIPAIEAFGASLAALAAPILAIIGIGTILDKLLNRNSDGKKLWEDNKQRYKDFLHKEENVDKAKTLAKKLGFDEKHLTNDITMENGLPKTIKDKHGVNIDLTKAYNDDEQKHITQIHNLKKESLGKIPKNFIPNPNTIFTNENKAENSNESYQHLEGIVKKKRWKINRDLEPIPLEKESDEEKITRINDEDNDTKQELANLLDIDVEDIQSISKKDVLPDVVTLKNGLELPVYEQYKKIYQEKQLKELIKKHKIDEKDIVGYSQEGQSGIITSISTRDNVTIDTTKDLSPEQKISVNKERIERKDRGETVQKEQNISKEEPNIITSDNAQYGKSSSKEQLVNGVYDAFRNAGFSDNQAKALTAEVGRENSYNPETMFGKHQDMAAHGGTNFGIFSFEHDRQAELKERLSKKGLIDSNGNIIKSQEALNEQAKFVKYEMENKKRFTKTKNEFLNNPDIDPETASRVVGKDYIGWAIGQETIRGKGGERIPFPWKSHDLRRRKHLEYVTEVVNKRNKSENSYKMVSNDESIDNKEKEHQTILSRYIKPEQNNVISPEISKSNIVKSESPNLIGASLDMPANISTSGGQASGGSNIGSSMGSGMPMGGGKGFGGGMASSGGGGGKMSTGQANKVGSSSGAMGVGIGLRNEESTLLKAQFGIIRIV